MQALRTLARARQRLHDELVPVFPELVDHLPDHADLGAEAVLRLLAVYSSASAFAQAPLDALSRVLAEVSAGRWALPQAQALHAVARSATASSRAGAARALVVRTLALHLLDLRTRIAALAAALAAVLRIDPRPASSCKRRSLASDRPGPRPSVPSWAMSPAALAWSR